MSLEPCGIDIEKLKMAVHHTVETEFLQQGQKRPTLLSLELRVKELQAQYMFKAFYSSEEFGEESYVTYCWKKWDDDLDKYFPREWRDDDYERIGGEIGRFIITSPSWDKEYVRTLESSSKERNEIIAAKAMEILEPLGVVERLQIVVGHGLIWEAQAILRIEERWHFVPFEMCEYCCSIMQDQSLWDDIAGEIAEGITEDYFDLLKSSKLWINPDKKLKSLK